MATLIRAEISQRSKYWIDKHRHYELKHFCLQYPSWKDTYSKLSDPKIPLSSVDRLPSGNLPTDPTAKRAIIRAMYAARMDIIEKAAMEADKCLYDYIIKAVTEGLSYTYLKTRLRIPCSKDTYYDRYRKFFWILDNSRN
jgi:hypothetical protein